MASKAPQIKLNRTQRVLRLTVEYSVSSSRDTRFSAQTSDKTRIYLGSTLVAATTDLHAGPDHSLRKCSASLNKSVLLHP